MSGLPERFVNSDRLDPLPGWKWGDLYSSRGFARCYGCHRPGWKHGPSHTVWYTERNGSNALCERCWQRSNLQQRLDAYKWLAHQNSKWVDDFAEVWAALYWAITAESAE